MTVFSRDMHYIQKEILISLAYQSPQRFSQLQPSRIPNNTFSYHLKKLIEAGYITLIDGGYVATRKALKTLQFDGSKAKRTGSPALITLIYITNSENKILLLKRNNRPFVDWYGIPSGLVHNGEELGLAAQREMYEKTNINASSLSFSGVLDFKYLEKDSKDLFVHAVAFIYKHEIKGVGVELEGLKTKYGTLHWSNLKSTKMVLPEVHYVRKIIEDKTDFLESVDFEEPVTEN
ncbi:MAG: NUDIX domain-containing protein [Candidatus Saccharimonadales bacterium]